MKRYFKYVWLRFLVKLRNRKRIAESNKIFDRLTAEQKAVFELVVRTAKKHPERILYDSVSSEVLIVEPTRLFTMCRGDREYSVSIHNHSGFHSQWFSEQSFDHLKKQVDIEAHRYRRQLKHEVKLNILAFIQNISDEIDEVKE